MTLKSTKNGYTEGFEGVLDENNLDSKKHKKKNRMQTNDKTYTLLSPILPLQLSVKKPKDSKKYPRDVITVGDEFKQARLDRKLTQLGVAKELSVNKNFVYELENNKRKITIYALYKTYLFLGYIPKILEINKTTLQGKLFIYRIKSNLTYSKLEKETKLNKSTISNFEKGKNCNIKTEDLIKIFLVKNS
ncbi:helix-turn-helix transcriptional regulator [Polaribacter sp. PL03]|uniref:helix-turn-helix transcriptional regulator n=1 Tax=Polaribacter sp. PL03 TaxID=3088353 RepID=UPI0029CFF101|nr:helix-turn-helix transcriptional regulator [Polaribacter sp. PL03]MDX6747539.1 helix-turn-helix transcriptional regulator [Polaribacter sp. PL03]